MALFSSENIIGRVFRLRGMKRGVLILVVFIVGGGVLFWRNAIVERINLLRIEHFMSFDDETIGRPRFIAHGGGEFQGQLRTNSLEALQASYEAGFFYMELDFSWTRDDELVALHDWDGSKKAWFGLPVEGPMTLDEFTQAESQNGLTHVTLAQLAEWMRTHGQRARVVTDIKRHNHKGLKLIASRYPDLINHFVPQAYNFEGYALACDLGFKDVILTTYRSKYRDDEIYIFAAKRRPFAITMPHRRAATDLTARLHALGMPVFAHGTENPERIEHLFEKGVHGIYAGSSSLIPDRVIAADSSGLSPSHHRP